MIRVRVNRDELTRAGQGEDGAATPMKEQQYVLHRLQRAGVPVQGAAFLVSLERGTLSMRKEPDTGGYLYTWTDA